MAPAGRGPPACATTTPAAGATYREAKAAAAGYWAARGALAGAAGPLGPWPVSDPAREAFRLPGRDGAAGA